MVDATVSKTVGHNARAGSTPALGTNHCPLTAPWPSKIGLRRSLPAVSWALGDCHALLTFGDRAVPSGFQVRGWTRNDAREGIA